jgi:molybdate transport system substrate-binding protein
VSAGELKVAVAANFVAPMAELAASFEAATEHTVVLVPGSSGRLYAQIRQGAPYDVFFSADRERVERLVEEGPAVPGSAFVYARGRLVLWSADAARSVDATTLTAGAFRRLAVANPRLAPYGAAAEETLRALGRWDALEPRLVRGESVTQTFQFVASGAAELGLVAKSQVLAAGGAAWEMPAELHRPIEQAAVALRAVAGALDLLQHVREQGGEVLRRHGYEVP